MGKAKILQILGVISLVIALLSVFMVFQNSQNNTLQNTESSALVAFSETELELNITHEIIDEEFYLMAEIQYNTSEELFFSYIINECVAHHGRLNASDHSISITYPVSTQITELRFSIYNKDMDLIQEINLKYEITEPETLLPDNIKQWFIGITLGSMSALTIGFTWQTIQTKSNSSIQADKKRKFNPIIQDRIAIVETMKKETNAIEIFGPPSSSFHEIFENSTYTITDRLRFFYNCTSLIDIEILFHNSSLYRTIFKPQFYNQFRKQQWLRVREELVDESTDLEYTYLDLPANENTSMSKILKRDIRIYKIQSQEFLVYFSALNDSIFDDQIFVAMLKESLNTISYSFNLRNHSENAARIEKVFNEHLNIQLSYPLFTKESKSNLFEKKTKLLNALGEYYIQFNEGIYNSEIEDILEDIDSFDHSEMEEYWNLIQATNINQIVEYNTKQEYQIEEISDDELFEILD